MMLELGYVFTDGCVLQRDKEVLVFGTAEKGAEVTVEIAGLKAVATAENGYFEATLPAHPAGGPFELKVSVASEVIALKDVVYGDVWLAGGQSNMEFQLKNCTDLPGLFEDYKAGRAAALENIRFYDVPHVADDSADSRALHRASAWEHFNPETLPEWTAVPVFFAKKIAEETGVTIGIVDCNWGGTSASMWMDIDTLANDPETHIYIDDYNKAYDGDYDKYLQKVEEYKVYGPEWERKKDECYRKNPDIDWNEVLEICGPCLWPGPMGPLSEYRPAGLYSAMLKPIAPYTLKGFIYYQGENDEIHPDAYFALLSNMIGVWRSTFRDAGLPFLLVQLPAFKNRNDKATDGWGRLRRCQEMVARRVENAGMAVAIDLGTFNNIHPPMKKQVGTRLALEALYRVYGTLERAQAEGPFISSFKAEGSTARIYPENAEGGLAVKQDACDKAVCKGVAADAKPFEIPGFEAAGEDGHYYKAHAELEASGDGALIRLSCPKVEKIKHIAYLRHNWEEPAIFGLNGLPLAPYYPEPGECFNEDDK